jgi:formylglycine-generating enzyme required for sulfatase activity
MGKSPEEKNRMSVRAALLGFLALFMGGAVWAQDTKYPPLLVKKGEISRFEGQIPGPEKPEEFPAWVADIRNWRRERLVKMGYRDAEYTRPELLWTQKSFIQTLLQVSDRYFYDTVSRRYTVDRFLDDLRKRYGGIDCVIVWPHYPNIGIDDRNQCDLLRDMPGGLPALKRMVSEFHDRKVRVLFGVIPWDQGTRSEGVSDWDALAPLLAEIGTDGIYGDTFNEMPLVWREMGDAARHPFGLEPQNALLAGALAWNHMTWGEGWRTGFVPAISAHKWLERRHMVHIVRRRARDRADDLQHAFFNGTGYVSWENIWGSWNGITDRDAQAMRRLAKIERFFSDLVAAPEWEPHTPTLPFGVFASKFPGPDRVLWTMVNRNEYPVNGRQIVIPWKPRYRVFDLWNGTELTPELEGENAILSFPIEEKGYGAIMRTSGDPPSGSFVTFLAEMKEMAKTPLRDLAAEWIFLPQKLVETPPMKPVKKAPADMVWIPGGDFVFKVSGIETEGEDRVGEDVQYPFEDSPRRRHLKKMSLPSFFMDRYPVTNGEFKKFIDATGYRPDDDHNFLKHWKNGSFPKEWLNKPVVWVSLEDARAYAAWAGKRLPHEWEWQYAAQGRDGRLYPWGNEPDPSALPIPEKGREMREPTDVSSFPKGSSPFGVMDLVGNVWQWTDEYRDEHTRFGVLRGGSYYQPQGSSWYFPQAYRLDQHGKYLLVSPGRDRSAAIGFRCAADADRERAK